MEQNKGGHLLIVMDNIRKWGRIGKRLNDLCSILGEGCIFVLLVELSDCLLVSPSSLPACVLDDRMYSLDDSVTGNRMQTSGTSSKNAVENLIIIGLKRYVDTEKQEIDKAQRKCGRW